MRGVELVQVDAGVQVFGAHILGSALVGARVFLRVEWSGEG